ncbi:MAG: hypothetical protein J7L96_07890 [Bacteroidales bacterium]|nr:hypothetical protein [Bacteroidales bacterium]
MLLPGEVSPNHELDWEKSADIIVGERKRAIEKMEALQVTEGLARDKFGRHLFTDQMASGIKVV